MAATKRGIWPMCTRLRWFRPALFCRSFCAAALVLVLFSSTAKVLAGEPQWVEVRSPNFSVVTDAGEKRGREVAMHFEQMRAVFGALMTKAKVSLPVPLQIVAFRNTKEMRQVAPLWRGKPTEVAGLFQGGSDRNFIMLDMSVENPYSVVFHEYAHQLLNGNMQAETDPWFEEGFAEYFSSIEVDGKEAHVGKIPSDVYQILGQFGTMKIADLFKVRQNSQTYNESGDHRTTFYAESGMLMHYLYDNQLLPKVAVYFDLKDNQKVSVEDAIQQAFGMSAPQFDKVLHGYIIGGRFRYYKIAAPANISANNFAAAPLKSTDAQAVVADIHLHSPDYQEQARSEFENILKSDPNNAAACRGLGYAYLQKQDLSHAAEYFKRAAQLDSKDPRVHYYSAMLMARESGFTSAADLSAMTKELQTAISLDPDFADSYAMLAFAQTTSGDPAAALLTMQKALALSPRNETYLYNLANIYLANRQPEKALPILQTLRIDDNPELAARVAGMMAQLQRFRQSAQARADSGMVLARPESTDNSTSKTVASENPPAAPPDLAQKWSSPKFLRGTLSSVDCSTEPSVMLTVISATKTLKMKVADRNQVILIGADQLSCAWSKRKVAVNYRENDAGEIKVVSLELQ